MLLTTVLLCVLILVGFIAVASNPSPYFAALGLVVVSGSGCALLLDQGGSFLSLVLFLIYLGGMLVVFAYSAALSAEPFPSAWGMWGVGLNVAAYLFMFSAMVVGLRIMGLGGSEVSQVVLGGSTEVIREDYVGVSLVYSGGAFLLVAAAGVLLRTLLVVLELTRGLSRGGVRYV
uniref:NADH-ubiquinone oxidoreductase chain 6 n=1 Tax=Solenostomus cyanopterus TaxID=270527 RepID=A7BHS2_9TELE|nr:NADH dehydrogenase subunit 6 [Solenostomus cyanopterus]BAF74897.1 NADH dehydrogenase subunit 6 [Solenostomus cyanopterus]BBU25694.1 NADH dehydrogenase subunit 6 [Solenostomus cyanopterus]